jgi:magnesium transporter
VDALLHAMIDAIVDRYFVVIEELADDIDALEDLVISGRARHPVARINHFKHECQLLRRAIWPVRESLFGLQRAPTAHIHDDMQVYFRDVHDHCVHILDQLDAIREQTSGLLDIHLTSVSNRQNAELRVLTVVTTLFSPAMLVTGFFGMNFHQMPLIEHQAGWALALLMIGLGGIALLAALYWRRWWARGDN